MPEVALRRGEKLIAEWRPSLTVFLRKLVFVAFVTAVLLGAVGYQYGLLFWLAGLPLTMAVYMLIFDDYTEWVRRRGDIWRLTNQRLMLFDTSESGSPASVDLADIKVVRRWMWWAVKVRMSNGQTTTMSFLPDQAKMRAAVLTARDAATGATHA